MSKQRPKKKSKKTQASRTTKEQPPYLWWGLLLLATTVAFWPSLQNGFTNWDDPVYVLENSWVINGNWKALLTEPVSLNYHPLTMLSLAVNYQISGLEPFGYHLTNLLLHLINTILVFIFVRRLAPKATVYVAFFTALVFGVHPMHVESVGWVSERKDVLYVLFFLGGLIVYLRHIEKPNAKTIGKVGLLFLLALLSKAMAVVFPVVLVLLDWYRGRKFEAKVWYEKILFFSMSLFFGLLAYRIQSGGAIAEFDQFTIIDRLVFAGYGFCMYLVKAIFPTGLSAFYPYPFAGGGSVPGYFYVMPLLALGIVGGAYLARKNRPAVSFGIGFYLVTVALVLQFISVGKAIMADRYTYLPYVGLFFMLFYLLFQWAGKVQTRQRTALAISTVFSVLLLILCFQRTKVWKDSEVLWTDVIEKYPDTADEAYANRGSYRGKAGQLEEALPDLQKAVAINPQLANAYESLGNAYGAQGQFQQSLDAFSQAIAINDQKPNYYLNRAISKAQLGRVEEAVADFDQALNLGPNAVQRANILTNRGVLYMTQSQWPQAESDCLEALSLLPNQATACNCLARVYAGQGQKAKALEYAQRAQALGFAVDPNFLQQLQN